jgi:hypothetical protein
MEIVERREVPSPAVGTRVSHEIVEHCRRGDWLGSGSHFSDADPQGGMITTTKR